MEEIVRVDRVANLERIKKRKDDGRYIYYYRRVSEEKDNSHG